MDTFPIPMASSTQVDSFVFWDSASPIRHDVFMDAAQLEPDKSHLLLYDSVPGAVKTRTKELLGGPEKVRALLFSFREILVQLAADIPPKIDTDAASFVESFQNCVRILCVFCRGIQDTILGGHIDTLESYAYCCTVRQRTIVAIDIIEKMRVSLLDKAGGADLHQTRLDVRALIEKFAIPFFEMLL